MPFFSLLLRADADGGRQTLGAPPLSEGTALRAELGPPMCATERHQVHIATFSSVEGQVLAQGSYLGKAWREAHDSSATVASEATLDLVELERCWRDVHTATQHLQIQDGRWETAGREP